MTERSVEHATLVLERIYEASPARVFAAWASPEALMRWGLPGDGWQLAFDKFEFRVGGGEICRIGPPGGDTYLSETLYLDIVPDARIVFASTMTSGGKRLFAGLSTVELHPAGAGCRLVMTEQAAFLDGNDIPANHEAGWTKMLENLGEALRRDRAAA